MSKKPNFLKATFKGLIYMYKGSPRLTILYSCMAVVHGCSWGLVVLFTQRFFDSATAFSQRQTDYTGVILALLGLIGANVLSQIMNGVHNYFAGSNFLKSESHLTAKLAAKLSKISPSLFEDTQKLDSLNKAEQGILNMAWVTSALQDALFFYTPYFVFMGIYLFTLKPILAISIIAVFIPNLFSQILRVKFFSKLEDQAAPLRRENDYYQNCLIDKEYLKETRLLGASNFFEKLYFKSMNSLNSIILKTNIKKNLLVLLMSVVSTIGYGVVILMLFHFVMNKEISIGAFAAVLASVGTLYYIMKELIESRIGNASSNVPTLQNYFEIVEMKTPELKKVHLHKNYDIKLENISFSYPNADYKAVKNANFTIKNGETIAIVGENGSGKTTICRLISGLYTPTDGDVFYGDESTKNIPFEQIFSKNSAVFQKFNRYKMAFRDNIEISDFENKREESVLDDICEKSGIFKTDKEFIDGYDTMLSRDFDGIDLSGGQWQRVSIARGLNRPHELIVLDEPTAAIDPLEETKIYNRFAEISKGKTTVIVTHRLGSVKLADRIVVMKKGEVVQIGTHENLMAEDGEYRRMYLSQQKWYE